MTDIDFLPAEYLKRRASQREQWYLLGVGVAALVLLLASVIHEARHAAQLREQLASVDQEYKDALLQVEELKELEQQRAPLAFDARFYSLLRARPSFCRAIVALASTCPTRLSLTGVRIRPIQLTRVDPNATPNNTRPAANPTSTTPVNSRADQLDRFSNQRELTRLTLELTGVADSDLEVAEFIERLQKAGCFTDVLLVITDSQSAGPSEVRGFKIHCRLAEVL